MARFNEAFSARFQTCFCTGPRQRAEATLANGGDTSDVAPLTADRNHTLFHHRKFCGQRTCAQLHRQLLGRLYREIATHLP